MKKAISVYLTLAVLLGILSGAMQVLATDYNVFKGVTETYTNLNGFETGDPTPAFDTDTYNWSGGITTSVKNNGSSAVEINNDPASSREFRIYFAAAGQGADLSGADYLQFWIDNSEMNEKIYFSSISFFGYMGAEFYQATLDCTLPGITLINMSGESAAIETNDVITIPQNFVGYLRIPLNNTFKKTGVFLASSQINKIERFSFYVINGGTPTAGSKLYMDDFGIITKNTPAYDGVINSNEWDISKKFVLNKDNGSVFNSESVGTIGDRSADFYFTWDKDGIYMATTVKDTTPVQSYTDTMWFKFADCVQVAFNPGLILQNSQPSFFTIGAKENAKPVVYKHYIDPAPGDFTSKIDGYSTKNTNGTYSIEMMFPWSTILTAGKTDNNLDADLSGWKPEIGKKIGLILTVCDKSAASMLAYKTEGSMAFNGSQISLGGELNADGSVTLKTVQTVTPTDPDPDPDDGLTVYKGAIETYNNLIGFESDDYSPAFSATAYNWSGRVTTSVVNNGNNALEIDCHESQSREFIANFAADGSGIDFSTADFLQFWVDNTQMDEPLYLSGLSLFGYTGTVFYQAKLDCTLPNITLIDMDGIASPIPFNDVITIPAEFTGYIRIPLNETFEELASKQYLTTTQLNKIQLLSFYIINGGAPATGSKLYLDDFGLITQNTPVFDGVLGANEWDASKKFVLNKDNGAVFDNGSVGEIGDRSAEFYFTWDKDGIYIAAKVKDTTPVQSSADPLWFNKADCIQVGFNPGLMIQDSQPSIFTIGASENAKPVVYKHSIDPAPGDITGQINGFSTKNTDGTYTIEMVIPWSSILTSGETNNGEYIDLTYWTPCVGAQMGLFLAVGDMSDSSAFAYKSDASNTYKGSELALGCELNADASISLLTVQDITPPDNYTGNNSNNNQNNTSTSNGTKPNTGDNIYIFVLTMIFCLMLTTVFTVIYKKRLFKK